MVNHRFCHDKKQGLKRTHMLLIPSLWVSAIPYTLSTVITNCVEKLRTTSITKAIQVRWLQGKIVFIYVLLFLKVFSLFNGFIMTNPIDESDSITLYLLLKISFLLFLGQPVKVMSSLCTRKFKLVSAG